MMYDKGDIIQLGYLLCHVVYTHDLIVLKCYELLLSLFSVVTLLTGSALLFYELYFG